MKRIFKVEPGGERLDAFLARCIPTLSRAFLKEMIKGGAVRVDGAQMDPDEKTSRGQRIVMDLPDGAGSGGEDFESWVLFEDSRLLVLDKPAGLLMHPLGSSWLQSPEAARAESEPNLAALLQVHRPAILRAKTPRCGIVHRLDRPTSGVLLVAKDPASYEVLVAAFKAREVHKVYRAIVRGAPGDASRVRAPIGRAPGSRRVVVTPLGKPAETGFKVLGRRKGAALVEATPLTGRTHQIRAHLAYLGFPVAGDPEFDQVKLPAPPRMMLHARRISFAHPSSGRPAEFAAEPPSDFVRYWRSLPSA